PLGTYHAPHRMKQRLDQRLAALGLTESREQARRLIMAGEVTVNGQVVDRPAVTVAEEAAIEIRTRPRFVSRGGEKLDAALEQFQISVAGLVCADVGASTGGFTDVLLQRGAARVYAIDVGRGILDYRLRTDSRVAVMEETNARYLEQLPEPARFVSIDASFISLKLLLPVVKGWISPMPPSGASAPAPQLKTGAREWGSGGDLVCLIKPQFEAGRKDVGKGGVVRDPNIHRRVLAEVLAFAQGQGFDVNGLMPSPLRGPKGNVEFLAWLAAASSAAGGLKVDSSSGQKDLAPLIDAALQAVGADEI
ncbi:MAG: TlyA family RNA methyltransferase, partial [Anaerolineales bacterium]